MLVHSTSWLKMREAILQKDESKLMAVVHSECLDNVPVTAESLGCAIAYFLGSIIETTIHDPDPHDTFRCTVEFFFTRETSAEVIRDARTYVAPVILYDIMKHQELESLYAVIHLYCTLEREAQIRELLIAKETQRLTDQATLFAKTRRMWSAATT